MNRVREVGESKKDVNLKTAQMVQLISEIGPDIPEISRRLGQFKESVRYRYKEKIIEKGFGVQANVNHEKLGLRRVVAVVHFAAAYRPYAESILTAMSELSYLVSFERTLPDDSFLTNASVPAESVSDYLGFLNQLKGKGLFTEVKSYEFDIIRLIPMRADYYDFRTGMWDFAWSTPPAARPDTSQDAYRKPQKETFDLTDLLILKELQRDATLPLVAIASTLRISYKKLAWHHKTHVLSRGLIKGYSLRWMGTRYDYAAERAMHRQHRYLRVDLLAKDVSERDRLELMFRSNRVPFLWAEAWGRDYYAQFAFPVEQTNEAMQYMTETMTSISAPTKYFLMDQSNAVTFTISYKLFDQTKKRWVFDAESLLGRFAALLEIRKGSG